MWNDVVCYNYNNFPVDSPYVCLHFEYYWRIFLRRYPEEVLYAVDGRYPDEERRPIRELYEDPYYERDRLFHDPDSELILRHHERELFERDLDRKLAIDSYLVERDRDLYRREGLLYELLSAFLSSTLTSVNPPFVSCLLVQQTSG